MSRRSYHKSRHPKLLSVAIVTLLVLGGVSHVHAEDRTKTKLFKEDSSKEKRSLQSSQTNILNPKVKPSENIDIQAPIVKMDRDTDTVTTDGGTLLSGNGMETHSEKAVIHMGDKTANLEGDVIVSGQSGSIRAEKGVVNFEDETGQFDVANFLYDIGGYSVTSDKVFKLSETRYKLYKPKMTTCTCDDDDCPWYLYSSEGDISKEGYAHMWNATLRFYDVPVFYTPYISFPAKMMRAPGLLAPDFGYSNRDGFKYKQPVFQPLSESTDLILSPFIETKTRQGIDGTFRYKITDDEKVESHLIYSDESARESDLRGANTDGLVDPTVDTNRFAASFTSLLKGDKSDPLPYTFLTDIHHVGDGLMAKELPNNDIVGYSDRVATSTTLVRSQLGEYFIGEVAGEYNEAIVGDRGDPVVGRPSADKTTFQKAPEASLNYLKSFSPLGQNAYGLKVLTKATLTETSFVRGEGYEGDRTFFNPSATVPFHVGNYVSGNASTGLWTRAYSLSKTENTTFADDDAPTNSIPYYQGSLTTSFEKVFDVSEDSPLGWLTSLGSKNQESGLTKVKNSIDPFVQYTYIPKKDQSDIPQFDLYDRVTEKSFVLYGVSTSLLGKFEGRQDTTSSIPEFLPQLGDLPVFGDISPLPGSLPSVSASTLFAKQRDSREILDLTVQQGYDAKRIHDPNPTDGIREYPFTDITTALSFTPNGNYFLKLDNYYNRDEGRISGWSITNTFFDDRQDSFSLRYSYVGPQVGTDQTDPQIDQIDGGIEGVLSERLKLGVYSQYDSLENEFISNRIALRLKSACDCWSLDFGVSDKINPDKQTYYVTLNLAGLGDITQNVRSTTGSSGQ